VNEYERGAAQLVAWCTVAIVGGAIALAYGAPGFLRGVFHVAGVDL